MSGYYTWNDSWTLDKEFKESLLRAVDAVYNSNHYSKNLAMDISGDMSKLREQMASYNTWQAKIIKRKKELDTYYRGDLLRDKTITTDKIAAGTITTDQSIRGVKLTNIHIDEITGMENSRSWLDFRVEEICSYGRY